LITIAGKSITFTSHDIIMMLVLLRLDCFFWTAALSQPKKGSSLLKRSSGTDQVTFELIRIADTRSSASPIALRMRRLLRQSRRQEQTRRRLAA